MSGKGRLWATLVAGAALAVGAWIGVERYRYRFVHSDVELLYLLPRADATTFFADVAALRHTGYLKLLSGAQAKQEKDYTTFVQETGFDYTKDLEAAAGAYNGRETFFALRGKFDWSAIRHYLEHHGGSCEGDLCKMATETPGRVASLHRIQPDVIGLAVGPDTKAAAAIFFRQEALAPPSNAPLWVQPSSALLKNPTDLPLAVRIFAIALESAETVVLEVREATAGDGALALGIDARFRNHSMADTARSQLSLNTDLLKMALAREHKTPAPSDLAWLMTSGKFEVSENHLIGSWTAPKALLDLLR